MNGELRDFGFLFRRESWLISLFTDGWYLHFTLGCPWLGFELCWLNKSVTTLEIESGFRIYGEASITSRKYREVLDSFMFRQPFEAMA